jgi:hypothetical protein
MKWELLYSAHIHPKMLTALICGTFWLLLYAHRHQSILGAAGHIILTPANHLMVMGLNIIGHCPIRVSNQGPFDHWPNALINCANRSHIPTALTGLQYGTLTCVWLELFPLLMFLLLRSAFFCVCWCDHLSSATLKDCHTVNVTACAWN